MKTIWLETVDSTNEYLRQRLSDFAEGDAVAAEKQTAGKGTAGRSFFSEGGLYFSFVVRAGQERLPLVTRAIAVAVRDVLYETFSVPARIKWVNDIYVDFRKVCGILCEHTGEDVIVGIGINLCEPEGGFPDDLKDIASALTKTALTRDEKTTLIKSVIIRFFSLLHDLNAQEINECYAARLNCIGRTVEVTAGGRTIRGRAVRLDENGYLVVKNREGEHTFSSGTLRFILPF